MTSRDEPTKTTVLRGYALSKRVLKARDHDAAVAEIFLVALEMPRADRAYFGRLTPQGSVEITHSSNGKAPEHQERSECIEASRQAVERHRRRTAGPHDVGSNDHVEPETDESIPLSIVAKILPEGGAVLGIIVIVRDGAGTFDEFERGCFTIMSHHAAFGLAQRNLGRPAAAPEPAKEASAAAPPPLADPEHRAAVKRAQTRRLTRDEVAALTWLAKKIAGKGRAHWKLLEEIVRFAPTDLPVLILGESGTGKELIARALHELSLRCKGPFNPVNTAALPDGLIESELFGHLEGAFSGATRAQLGIFQSSVGGTVFLDEVGELPKLQQPKLLRCLQEKSVRPVGGAKEVKTDFRLVAATNQPLEALVAKGEFREDLFYRLSTFVIHVPPLRERREDIPLLVERFIEKMGPRRPQLSAEAWATLEKHPFPGNIRQLEQAVQRAVALKSDPVTPADLGLEAAEPEEEESTEAGKEPKDLRRERFAKVYESTGKNVKRSSEVLKVDRNTVARVLDLWDLKKPKRRRS